MSLKQIALLHLVLFLISVPLIFFMPGLASVYMICYVVGSMSEAHYDKDIMSTNFYKFYMFVNIYLIFWWIMFGLVYSM